MTLSPSLVQGEKADDQIIKALEMLTTFNESYKIDLIIIARGGGSLEDLWCFNSEKLARKIYSLEIPIISAIGHETDFTICDLVSDLRAPTPSSAAEIISQEHSNFFDRLIDLKRNGLFSLQKNFSNKKNFLKQNLNIFNKVDLNLDQKSLRLDENQNRFTFLLIFNVFLTSGVRCWASSRVFPSSGVQFGMFCFEYPGFCFERFRTKS